MSKCKICNNSEASKTYIAREMMFGYGDEFEYFECSECGCLQIKLFPNNLAKYYSPDYMSFCKPNIPKLFFPISFIKQRRLRYSLGEKDLYGILFSKIFGNPSIPVWLPKAEVKSDYSILDVGCGVGRLLLRLRRKGFYNLTGIDPFIKDNIFYKNGVQIYKKYLEEFEGQFDFIMLHHSLEHMPDPLSSIKELYRLVKPKRYVLIRIPIVSSFAWRKYRTNWIQLDAPRHLFLHSVKSIQILADKTNFKVADVVYDSKSVQFWGSELYEKQIEVKKRHSFYSNIKKRQSFFSKKELQKYEQKAKELNAQKDGDQACFYLYKE
ncbi:MAG: class I SAM-dependent methyltransferase [Planctomycetes bacterium]|nr:class I SAM-dependent methyltransferase [Planctomycetota bacterium]